jgi:CBS domain-containing protein
MDLSGKIDRFTVTADVSIESAWALIDANGHRSVLVLGEHRDVLGSLSDGDIRRALLQRRLLSTPVDQVMNTNFVAVRPGRETDAAALFSKHHIFLIPVIGDADELLDILTSD